MNISKRLGRIKPSATMAMNTKALELKSQGVSVVSLAVGEPDFPTPERVRHATAQAMDEGFTRYTPVAGIPELRQAVTSYYKSVYGCTTSPEQVIVTNGGKQALYNLFMSLLDPGDEVLIPTPYWVSYPDMVILADGVPVFVPTALEDDYLVTPEDLEPLVTSKTRMVIINNPSNPTGCQYNQKQIDALAVWAMDRNIFIVADEVYDQLTYPPAEPATFAGWFEHAPDKICLINAVSKTFAMTGWRVGYAVTHPDLVKAMVKIQGQSTSGVCSIAQKGAVAALDGHWESLDNMRDTFRRRRDTAMSVIRSWDGVRCPLPKGAFYLFPDVTPYIGKQTPDSTTLCTRILEQARVALVPGAAFGADTSFRISFALSESVLVDALEKIGRVLKA
jgi:aspartate aminotransferase